MVLKLMYHTDPITYFLYKCSHTLYMDKFGSEEGESIAYYLPVALLIQLAKSDAEMKEKIKIVRNADSQVQ